MSRLFLVLISFALLCTACGSGQSSQQNEPKPRPQPSLKVGEPRIGMAIAEFHEICGGATDGAATEGMYIIYPYKPRAGRKPQCIGMFYFQNFKLEKIESLEKETAL